MVTSQGQPGNGSGRHTVAEAVSPACFAACARLTSVGVPDLRVERLSESLALSMLRNAPASTFTSWANEKKLTGAPGRELATHARVMDLAVADMGAGFLGTRSSEVSIRRMLAIALAARHGGYRMAGLLEELPGESALEEIPDSLLNGLAERMKLEMKLEQLGESKK